MKVTLKYPNGLVVELEGSTKDELEKLARELAQVAPPVSYPIHIPPYTPSPAPHFGDGFTITSWTDVIKPKFGPEVTMCGPQYPEHKHSCGGKCGKRSPKDVGHED